MIGRCKVWDSTWLRTKVIPAASLTAVGRRTCLNEQSTASGKAKRATDHTKHDTDGTVVGPVFAADQAREASLDTGLSPTDVPDLLTSHTVT